MIKWFRHNWGPITLGLYVLVVGYGLFVRDFGLWNAFFTAPLGFALVAGILFFLVYETLALTFPVLANTALFLLRYILPETRFVRVAARVNARWDRMPDFIKRSPWMPYRK